MDEPDITDVYDAPPPKFHRRHRVNPASRDDQDTAAADGANEERPTRRRTAEPVSTAGTMFRVHLGAFHSRDAADHEVERARTRGFSTQVVPISHNGRTLYRVQAGAFRERTRAESIKQSLQDASFDATVTEQ